MKVAENLETIHMETMPAALSGRRRHMEPIAEERVFGADEMFFSTTNLKGIIQSGNDVFVRVSGFERADLLGSAHNIVRHPDMPRSVFRLLWNEIEAGRPIAAYVKNMAQDGRYYWVVATIVPYVGGYLSVRIKPTSPFFELARALYVELLESERKIEAGDAKRRNAAIAASSELMLARLRAAGHPSYQSFMRAALLAEVRCRAAREDTPAHTRLSKASPGADPALAAVLSACAYLGAFLNGLVERLDTYATLYNRLTDKTKSVSELSDDVGLFSLNAVIAATRIGSGDQSLGTVAALMQSNAAASGEVFQHLIANAAAAGVLLEQMFYPIAATSLQAEMLMLFVRELIDGAGSVAATQHDLGALAGCLADGVEQLTVALTDLNAHMHQLGWDIKHVRSNLEITRALELLGRVESSRLVNAESVVALFKAMAGQIDSAGRETDELASVGAFSFRRDLADARRCRTHVAVMRRHLALLGLDSLDEKIG